MTRSWFVRLLAASLTMAAVVASGCGGRLEGDLPKEEVKYDPAKAKEEFEKMKKFSQGYKGPPSAKPGTFK